MLSGAEDVRQRSVDNHDTAGRRGRDVDVVQPDPGAGHDLERPGRRKHLRVHPGRAAHDQSVDARDRAQQRGPVGPVDVTDLELAGQQLQPGR